MPVAQPIQHEQQQPHYHPHHQQQQQQQQSQQQAQSAESAENLSLDALRARHAEQLHTLDVCEMRLKHCLESEDESSAGVAATAVAAAKRTARELNGLLRQRERREQAELAVREAIGRRFDKEHTTIQEAQRQVELFKARLRTAFFNPPPSSAAAACAVCTANEAMSPQPGAPPASAAASSASAASSYGAAAPSSSPCPSPAASFFSSSASLSSDAPLGEVVSRLRTDVGKQQVLLEHQNLRVDSVNLQTCLEAAAATAAAEEAAASSSSAADVAMGGEGSSSSSNSHDSFPSTPLSFVGLSSSESLSVFFKQSRREVVTSIQAVLDDCDGLSRHLKHAEAFAAYLQPPAAAAEQQQHQQRPSR
jgi:hypothetical protein